MRTKYLLTQFVWKLLSVEQRLRIHAHQSKSDGTNYEVIIAAHAVKGLHFLNEPDRCDYRRDNMNKDKTFIKALLISVCKFAAIRELKSGRELLSKVKFNKNNITSCNH